MINHFPGMIEICRKDFLARNVARIQKVSIQYDFFPKTWILPFDLKELEFHVKIKRKSTFICKPDNGCQGAGIFLFQKMDEFNAQRTTIKTKFQDSFVKNDCVVQEYKDTPLLLDGHKFDLRIYVLVKSFDPLTIYIYNDGLVRLATIPYTSPNQSNISSQCMHLTNYAITKESSNYIIDEEGEYGSKRSLKSLWKTLESKQIDTKKLWTKISESIVKTILLIQPEIKHVMATIENQLEINKCFEILGFDIMIDKDITPWVIEVNHSPSFTCDSKLDLVVKSSLITDTLRLLTPDFKILGQKKERAFAEKNGYSLIYPSTNQTQQEMYELCLVKIQDLNRSNKTEIERRKCIKTKLECAERLLRLNRISKEKHVEKTKIMASLHELRPVEVKEKKTRLDRFTIGKVALKISVTDLSFGL